MPNKCVPQPLRCCRKLQALHTVSASRGYCENAVISAPLLVVDVSMHSTVPTRPLLTPLYSIAVRLYFIAVRRSLEVLMNALSVKPQPARNSATSSPSRPRQRRRRRRRRKVYSKLTQ